MKMCWSSGLNCTKECMYVEKYLSFAKKCKRDGGLFKCCLTQYVYIDLIF